MEGRRGGSGSVLVLVALSFFHSLSLSLWGADSQKSLLLALFTVVWGCGTRVLLRTDARACVCVSAEQQTRILPSFCGNGA